MNPSPTPGRLLAACSIVLLSLALSFAPALGADRHSGGGQLLLWLLGLKMAEDDERPRVDINSATFEELRTVPGLERHQARRIIAERPYATLQDLVRAGLSTIIIERLARFLSVDSDWPSALPDRAGAPGAR